MTELPPMPPRVDTFTQEYIEYAIAQPVYRNDSRRDRMRHTVKEWRIYGGGYRNLAMAQAEVLDWPIDVEYKFVCRTVSPWQDVE